MIFLAVELEQLFTSWNNIIDGVVRVVIEYGKDVTKIELRRILLWLWPAYFNAITCPIENYLSNAILRFIKVRLT
ncbi:hypothetical protein DSUL_20362 [Desulfovibrionales bacterium]